MLRPLPDQVYIKNCNKNYNRYEITMTNVMKIWYSVITFSLTWFLNLFMVITQQSPSTEVCVRI